MSIISLPFLGEGGPLAVDEVENGCFINHTSSVTCRCRHPLKRENHRTKRRYIMKTAPSNVGAFLSFPDIFS